MEIFSSFLNGPRGAVIVIGNFDGVHRGHQFILQKAKAIAAEKARPPGVLTFEPHPRKLFRPDEPPGRLTPPDVKAWRLEEAGVEILYSIPFDWDFASRSAENFIEEVLKKGLDAAHVVVGHDFRFGQMRKGEPGDIEKAGIPVTVIDEVKDGEGVLFSSSAVREYLRRGEIDKANAMLGWEWEMRGEIVRGDRRGRALGYPTANMGLGETIHPAYGVYAARVNVEGEKEWYGAAVNIGIRPMFEVPEAQVESFIFDFDREIYGKILRVQPVQRLRSEAKFESVTELKNQMAEDCAEAVKILKK
ncbi:MAG: bifunctional riboflavin kinase/FAD synthetase [Alphaproteobacteria bacterium]|nr:bifunctional riboflavin kinase/FAD synthetase [Alphaproteobacteria bacterium]